jgi:hypothetical protein
VEGKKQGLFTLSELQHQKTIEEAISIAEKKKIKYAYKKLLKNLPHKTKIKKPKI